MDVNTCMMMNVAFTVMVKGGSKQVQVISDAYTLTYCQGNNDEKGVIPKVVMAIEYKKSQDIEENPEASDADASPKLPKNEVSVAQETTPSTDDLLV